MIVVHVKTINVMNARELWPVRAKRVKKEREATAWALSRHPKPQLPCSVLLTRVAFSNGLDDDGLAGALKGVRDEVANWLGVDDRHRDIVRYRYAQRRGPKGRPTVEITFGEPAAGAQLNLVEFA